MSVDPARDYCQGDPAYTVLFRHARMSIACASMSIRDGYTAAAKKKKSLQQTLSENDGTASTLSRRYTWQVWCLYFGGREGRLTLPEHGKNDHALLGSQKGSCDDRTTPDHVARRMVAPSATGCDRKRGRCLVRRAPVP